ncbi:MAG: PAS domain S-box protein [Opitutaceae bacterium]
MPAWIRKYTRGYQAWVPLNGIFILWLLTAPERTRTQRSIGIFFLLASNVMAAAALWRAAKRPDLPPHFSKGLRRIAYSLIIIVLGGVYVLLDLYLRPASTSLYNGSDFFFLLSYPVAMWGLLRMPRAAHPAAGLGRILIDSAVFAVGAGLPVWFLAVKPGLASAMGFGIAPFLAYPLAVFSGIVCLNIALLTRTPVPSRGAFAVLLTAIGISWLADLIFLLDSVEGFIMRSPIHWSNLLNSVALIGYLVAAGKIETDKPARQDDAHSPASGPLPIITIVMVSAWLLIYITYGRPIPEMLPGLLWSLLVLFAFLCFREIWMIRENARWMASTVKRESSARAEALMLEYLKAVFNSTPDMIWSVDPEQFGLQMWNLVLERTFREVRGISLKVGMRPNDLFPSDPLLAQDWRESYQRTLREGSYSKEYEIVAVKRILSLSLNLLGPRDRPFGISVFAKDVTESRRAEKALRESDERLRLALEANSEGVWDWDIASGRIVFNPSYLRSLGFNPDEFASDYDSWKALVHPDDLAATELALRRHILEGAPFSVEIRLRGRSGEWRWVLNRGTVVERDPSGRAVRMLGTHIDITKRKRDEEELYLQSAALEATINSVVITDTKGNIEWVNPAFTKATGYSADEVIGRNPRILKSGKQPDSYYAEMWRTITSGRIWSGEFVNLRKDGGLITEEVTISPVRDPQGAVIHFVAVKQDVSARKLLEKQLFQTQRLEVVGMLASGIAHDLNNVLAPILTGATLVRARMPGDSELQSVVAAMEKSAQRGASIVRQVLTFARGVRGERVPVQLRHLLAEVVSISEETFPKNIKTAADIAKDLWPIVGDASQLDQVVMNLCINARDAMPGGGLLTVTAENMDLDEAFVSMTPAAKAGPHVCIKVSDTGTGIPPDKYDKIFEPFFTTKEVGKGTGLGLATVQGIVKNHGGFVQFKSALGEGTRFEVYLPATPAAVPAPAGEHHPRPPQRHGETILIVDDDESIRIVTAKILRQQGYEILSASNGEQALAIFVQNRAAIRLVLTDMMMPVMDGLALVRVLRRIEPGIRVVGVTGVGEPTSLNAIEALDLSALLPKPYTADKLLQTLERVLEPAMEG